MWKGPRSVYDEWNIVFVALYYRTSRGLNVCENIITYYIKLIQSNSFLNCFLNINNAQEINIILLLWRTENNPSASWRFCQTVYIRIGKQIAIICRFNKLVFDQGGNEFVNRPTHNYGLWQPVPVCYLFNKRYINVLPTDCGRW